MKYENLEEPRDTTNLTLSGILKLGCPCIWRSKGVIGQITEYGNQTQRDPEDGLTQRWADRMKEDLMILGAERNAEERRRRYNIWYNL